MKKKAKKIVKKSAVRSEKAAAMQKLAAFQQMISQANPSGPAPGQNYKGAPMGPPGMGM